MVRDQKLGPTFTGYLADRHGRDGVGQYNIPPHGSCIRRACHRCGRPDPAGSLMVCVPLAIPSHRSGASCSWPSYSAISAADSRPGSMLGGLLTSGRPVPAHTGRAFSCAGDGARAPPPPRILPTTGWVAPRWREPIA